MDLKTANATRWSKMHISADKGPSFKSVADRLMTPNARQRYQAVSTKTGVPWEVIAVIHEREAGQKWDTQLGQGDPLNKKSVHKPKGRGPFATWEEGAIDALVNCAPYAAKNTDWSVGGTLAKLEEYNGLGYANKQLPSPYLWAGTDQYVKGKYVADGVYDPNHVDTQLGAAGLLKFMGWGQRSSAGAVAAGTVVAAGTGAAVTAPSNYLPWIIGATMLTALIAFLVFDIMSYNKWKKENAIQN
jgi:lysozyme family protein